MKKNNWFVWILYTLPFLIWYIAGIDSVQTALEEGNIGNFLLIWVILGASSVVHFATLSLINTKIIKKEVRTLSILSWLKDNGALFMFGGIVIAVVLAPITLLICVVLHLFITLLMLFKQKDLEDDYSNYSYTTSKPTTKPNPKPTATTKTNTATKTTPAVKKPEVKTVQRTQQKPRLNPKFSESGLKNAIKSETGNGDRFVISCRYCKRTYMTGFDVSVYESSDEIKVTFNGTIKIVLDKQELLENVTCQHDLDVKMDEVADSAERMRKSAVRSLYTFGQAGISSYERQIGGWIGKKVFMYDNIEVEEG